jgi:uncharacterized protein (DUF1501 family)
MAITRRQFITRTGLATAGTLLGPGLFTNPFVRQAMADTIGNRYLVVLFLDGGNDGLNTVVPYSSGALRTAYNGYRTNINLSQSSLSATTIGNDPQTGTQLALHPGFSALKALYNLGKVAVIQGCGYPEYSLSHEESRGIWQTGNPLGYSPYTGTGWVGRHLALEYTGSQVPGVCISGNVAPEFRQTGTSVLAINRLNRFGFPYDDFGPGSERTRKRTAFNALYAEAAAESQPIRSYVGDTGLATLLSSESYPQAHDVWQTERSSAIKDAYDAVDRSTSRDLREISKIIYAQERSSPLPNINAHFFHLSNGGYDTHSDQGAGEPDGQHYGLHKEVGDSLKVFYDDLVDMGAASRVCIVLWSEFARRIPQNDNGTDHGSQGPMFVIGGSVVGGVYGKHPDIFNLDNDENTPYKQGASATAHRSTDFRDVYGTVLKHFVNMTQSNILANVLPVDAGDPASYWASPNFDLGFLP